MKSEIKEKHLQRVSEIISKLSQARRDNPVVLQECFAATVTLYEGIYGPNSLQIDQLLGAVK